jgi:ABC-type transport system involved in multi-copper enzyme maturation permease subunit
VSWVVYSETVRRHLTSVAYWSLLGLLAIVAFGTARFNTPGAAWPPLITLLAIIAGCAPIGPEFSSGTLQLILVKPVNRSAYLLSRVAGVVTVVWIAAIVAAIAELLGRAVIDEPLHANILATTLLNVAISSVMVVSLLTFFGSFTRAYFNVAIYFVLQVGLGLVMALVAMGRRFPTMSRALQQVMNNLFPEEPRALDTPWLLMVLSNAAVALVLACLIFRRREVPYGGD